MNIPSDSIAADLSRRWVYAQTAAVCAMITSWSILKDGLAHFAWLFIIAGCVHTLGAILVARSSTSARTYLITSAACLLFFGACVSSILLAIGGFAWAVFDERGYAILTDLVVWNRPCQRNHHRNSHPRNPHPRSRPILTTVKRRSRRRRRRRRRRIVLHQKVPDVRLLGRSILLDLEM